MNLARAIYTQGLGRCVDHKNKNNDKNKEGNEEKAKEMNKENTKENIENTKESIENTKENIENTKERIENTKENIENTKENMFVKKNKEKESAHDSAGPPHLRKMVYISAVQFIRPLHPVLGIRLLPPLQILRGYYEGKQEAEAAVRTLGPAEGLVLRPGMIYGRRRVTESGWEIPLQWVGGPLRAVLSPMYAQCNGCSALTPPISAQEVARVALFGALLASPQLQGTMEVGEMMEVGGKGWGEVAKGARWV